MPDKRCGTSRGQVEVWLWEWSKEDKLEGALAKPECGYREEVGHARALPIRDNVITYHGSHRHPTFRFEFTKCLDAATSNGLPFVN